MCLLGVPSVWAQESPSRPAPPPPTDGLGQEVTIESGNSDFDEATGRRIDCENAVYELRGGIKFFADCIEYSKEDGSLVARGNVV